MLPIIGQQPEEEREKMVEIREHLFICDDKLIKQNNFYKVTEQWLYQLYHRWFNERDNLSLIEKVEHQLMSAYEDIMSLFVEREKMVNQIQNLTEEMRNDALDTCEKYFDICELKPNTYAVERLDQVWIKKTRDQLYEKAELRVKVECQLRAWDLADVMDKFTERAAGAWDLYDKGRIVTKKMVDEQLTNLVAYCCRVGQYPECMFKMRHHHRNISDTDAEIARHFKAVEKERVKNERVIMERTMEEEIGDGWVTGAVHDYEVQCRRKIALYAKLSDSYAQIDKLDFQTKLYLSIIYEGRQKFIAKQLREVKDILLRVKGNLPQNIPVLSTNKERRNNKE